MPDVTNPRLQPMAAIPWEADVTQPTSEADRTLVLKGGRGTTPYVDGPIVFQWIGSGRNRYLWVGHGPGWEDSDNALFALSPNTAARLAAFLHIVRDSDA